MIAEYTSGIEEAFDGDASMTGEVVAVTVRPTGVDPAAPSVEATLEEVGRRRLDFRTIKGVENGLG